MNIKKAQKLMRELKELNVDNLATQVMNIEFKARKSQMIEDLEDELKFLESLDKEEMYDKYKTLERIKELKKIINLLMVNKQ